MNSLRRIRTPNRTRYQGTSAPQGSSVTINECRPSGIFPCAQNPRIIRLYETGFSCATGHATLTSGVEFLRWFNSSVCLEVPVLKKMCCRCVRAVTSAIPSIAAASSLQKEHATLLRLAHKALRTLVQREGAPAWGLGQGPQPQSRRIPKRRSVPLGPVEE